ncbi:MAG: hypothetical protein OIF34_09600, partial [Porticoccaceae bacterium]|nr:hypothetical protein [Porticoccaceae bacterium]
MSIRKSALSALLLLPFATTPIVADDIEIVVAGQTKPPPEVRPYQKAITKDGIIYGLTRNDDANGTFVDFTMVTSSDGGQTWSS